MKQTLKYQTHTKTLKEMSRILGISYAEVRRIRDEILDKYPGVPLHQVFGGTGYLIDSFKRRLIK